jgi:hypothetical protein
VRTQLALLLLWQVGLARFFFSCFTAPYSGYSFAQLKGGPRGPGEGGGSQQPPPLHAGGFGAAPRLPVAAPFPFPYLPLFGRARGTTWHTDSTLAARWSESVRLSCRDSLLRNMRELLRRGLTASATEPPPATPLSHGQCQPDECATGRVCEGGATRVLNSIVILCSLKNTPFPSPPTLLAQVAHAVKSPTSPSSNAEPPMTFIWSLI